jgi:hypothetical protein
MATEHRCLQLNTLQIKLTLATAEDGETGSSVGIVSEYGLDDWAIEIRSPAEAKGFFPLASVSRTALGPTQSPVQWVPGFLSPGLKRGRGVTLTTHPPSSAKVGNE